MPVSRRDNPPDDPGVVIEPTFDGWSKAAALLQNLTGERTVSGPGLIAFSVLVAGLMIARAIYALEYTVRSR